MLEYCDSGDLRGIMKRPIKESFTKFYFSQLANGLKYLDSHNIIHRDIKPKNILLTNSRRVLKIADFGFAKQSKEQDLYETMCGSPLYMAPEITGHNYYTKQTDLWSIGMMLYEMLYNFHPFHKCKSLPELRNRIDDTKIDIPAYDENNEVINGNVSDECLSLLKKLLQKDVKERITWDEFFSHPWINQYQYINICTNKKNENYEDIICSMSLGSLNNDKNDPNDPKKYEESIGSVNIIENYTGNSRFTCGNNNKICENNCNNDNCHNKNKNKIDEVDECIFDIELEGENGESSCMVIKGIIDKSSILEDINENSHRYEIIDAPN